MLIFIKRKGPTYYNQYRGCKGVCGRGECSPYRYGAGKGGGGGGGPGAEGWGEASALYGAGEETVLLQGEST